MRSFAILLLATGALAAPQVECLKHHAPELSEYSDCAASEPLATCIAGLAQSDIDEVQACYVQNGCSEVEARAEARYILNRCEDWVPGQELRRRWSAMPRQNNDGSQNQSGEECFTTSTVQTKVCSTSTVEGKLVTGDCKEQDVAQSSCKPGKTCSMDKAGEDICMDVRNDLDIGGIIVAIIFAVAIVIGVATLTFLCCKERRDQKRLQAKADAVALARAQTKKKRNQDARAPLMGAQPDGPYQPQQQQQPVHPGAGDPFADRSLS